MKLSDLKNKCFVSLSILAEHNQRRFGSTSKVEYRRRCFGPCRQYVRVENGNDCCLTFGSNGQVALEFICFGRRSKDQHAFSSALAFIPELSQAPANDVPGRHQKGSNQHNESRKEERNGERLNRRHNCRRTDARCNGCRQS